MCSFSFSPSSMPAHPNFIFKAIPFIDTKNICIYRSHTKHALLQKYIVCHFEYNSNPIKHFKSRQFLNKLSTCYSYLLSTVVCCTGIHFQKSEIWMVLTEIILRCLDKQLLNNEVVKLLSSYFTQWPNDHDLYRSTIFKSKQLVLLSISSSSLSQNGLKKINEKVQSYR